MKDFVKEQIAKRNADVHKRLLDFSYRTRAEAIKHFYWSVGAGLSDQELLEEIKKFTDNAYISWIYSNVYRYKDAHQFLVNCIWDAQFENMMEDWEKTKQIYVFDRDFISEMAKTEQSISVPNNIFDKLPFKSFYLDFKQYPEICSDTGADGALVNISQMKVPEYPDDRLWLTQYVFFRNRIYYSEEANILNEAACFGGENSVINLEDICTSGLDQNGCNRKLLNVLVLQMILYLCSYEPDIRDDVASKMQRRKAKQQQKANRNIELPEQLHVVGERFGAAFRKWTLGSLGKESPTSSGGHVKPHMRRAHWHRYWIGKKGHQELIVKWVHECFCGCTEDIAPKTLDVVKHKI